MQRKRLKWRLSFDGSAQRKDISELLEIFYRMRDRKNSKNDGGRWGDGGRFGGEVHEKILKGIIRETSIEICCLT